MDATSFPIFSQPYVISLQQEVGVKGNIKDISFLGGYLQPTLLVKIFNNLIFQALFFIDTP